MSVLDYLNPLQSGLTDLIMNPQASVFGNTDGTADEHGAYGGFGIESPDGSSKALSASGGIGSWTDSKGGVNRGVNVEGGVYKTGQEDSGYTLFGQKVGWDAGLGTANAGIYDRTTVDENGLTRRTESVGAGANVGEGSVTVGDDSGGVRFGLSEGGGAAARRHQVDIDGDGEMEMNGFGLDVGPVSFDVKSDMIAEMLQDAPDLDCDLEDVWNIPDMIQNPDDYEMPSLDDYEMPDLDDYELNPDYGLPDFTDVPSLDEMSDYLPEMPSFPMFGNEEVAAPAAGPPTGLIDNRDLEDPPMVQPLPDDLLY